MKIIKKIMILPILFVPILATVSCVGKATNEVSNEVKIRKTYQEYSLPFVFDRFLTSEGIIENSFELNSFLNNAQSIGHNDEGLEIAIKSDEHIEIFKSFMRKNFDDDFFKNNSLIFHQENYAPSDIHEFIDKYYVEDGRVKIEYVSKSWISFNLGSNEFLTINAAIWSNRLNLMIISKESYRTPNVSLQRIETIEDFKKHKPDVENWKEYYKDDTKFVSLPSSTSETT